MGQCSTVERTRNVACARLVSARPRILSPEEGVNTFNSSSSVFRLSLRRKRLVSKPGFCSGHPAT